MVKMHAKNQQNDVARKNQNSLCDVEVILGLHYIFPLLKCVHALIKLHKLKTFLFATLWKL